jgi:hypothetical protein
LSIFATQKIKKNIVLETPIISKIRIKILLKFILGSKSYLRGLETEFEESTNTIRLEFNSFKNTRLTNSYVEKNKKHYKADTLHPLFSEINKFLKKEFRLENLLNVIEKNDNLKINKIFMDHNFSKRTIGTPYI